MGKHYNFIKEAYEGKHGTICQEWKDKIIEHFPEFKEEEFKNGDWIFFTESTGVDPIGTVAIIEKLHCRSFQYESDDQQMYAAETTWCRKATDKEIESHLIKEFHRKYQGEIFNNVDGDCINNFEYNKGFNRISYVPKRDSLYISQDAVGGQDVYRQGQWAEIIPTMTKEEAEKKLNCKILD